jgi:hypothetical protein
MLFIARIEIKRLIQIVENLGLDTAKKHRLLDQQNSRPHLKVTQIQQSLKSL